MSSPNRHSPIGIAARRFGGYFSAGALTAMTRYVYCRRVQSLHSFICGVGPSGFEKLKNIALRNFRVQHSETHPHLDMPPVSIHDSVRSCGRAGGRRGYRAPVPNRFASTGGGGAPSDPARDDTSETGRGWFGVGHAMPMVHGTIASRSRRVARRAASPLAAASARL